MNIKLYTDGACKGNPGPGGWGCILSTVLADGTVHERKYSGGFRKTTNNRMELSAVIYGLMQVKGCHDIEIISDSKYVCDAFNQGWIEKWKQNNWTKGKFGQLPNADLWQTLWMCLSVHNSYKFTWVKGHSTNPYNNECDRLAVRAAEDWRCHQIDEYYESGRC